MGCVTALMEWDPKTYIVKNQKILKLLRHSTIYLEVLKQNQKNSEELVILKVSSEIVISRHVYIVLNNKTKGTLVHERERLTLLEVGFEYRL